MNTQNLTSKYHLTAEIITVTSGVITYYLPLRVFHSLSIYMSHLSRERARERERGRERERDRESERERERQREIERERESERERERERAKSNP